MIYQMVDFLQELKKYFDIRRLVDYKEPSLRSTCLLRHDVDVSIDKALKLAKIEYSLNIQSTYFFLHDAKYYKDADFIKKCTEFQDMGHEVGFHNNLLTDVIITKRDIKDVFEKELDYLRKNSINIFGTAAHGDSACRKFDYTNYEIFKECYPPYKKKRERVKGIELHTLDLKDYGLYEAYFLPRDFYITDCAGSWRYIKGEGDEWDHRFQPHSPKFTDILPFLRKISEDNIILQALIHPDSKLIEIKEGL